MSLNERSLFYSNTVKPGDIGYLTTDTNGVLGIIKVNNKNTIIPIPESIVSGNFNIKTDDTETSKSNNNILQEINLSNSEMLKEILIKITDLTAKINKLSKK